MGKARDKACIFCGATKRTLEHATPEWLLEFIAQGNVRWFKTWTGPQRKYRAWKGLNEAIKVKCVCASCNGGWMSDLETKCKEIVVLLACNAQVLITKPGAILLATWATKSAMIGDCVHPNRYYSSDDCRYVRDHLTPPPATIVLLGHSRATDPPGDTIGINLGPHHAAWPTSLGVYGYVTTMRIGHLVLQVLSVRTTPNIDLGRLTIHAQHVEGDEHLVQLWPIGITKFDWPLRTSLPDNASFEAFARRFRPPD
jgi:hypothetical protein